MSAGDEMIVRIYREAFLTWWAELWRERKDSDPPAPFRSISLQDHPDGIYGYHRVDVRFCHTRWGARRAGRKMLSQGEKLKQDFKEEFI